MLQRKYSFEKFSEFNGSDGGIGASVNDIFGHHQAQDNMLSRKWFLSWVTGLKQASGGPIISDSKTRRRSRCLSAQLH